MTYTETLDRLATATEAQVVAAFASWQAGRLTLSAFLAVAASYLAAAGNKATALADTALAAFLTVQMGTAVPTLGLLPPEHHHRAELAIALLARKPHLSSRRPVADVGQGATKIGETVDLAKMLRARAL